MRRGGAIRSGSSGRHGAASRSRLARQPARPSSRGGGAGRPAPAAHDPLVETQEVSQAGSCVAFDRRRHGGILPARRTGLGPSSGGLEQHGPQHLLRGRNFLPLSDGQPGDNVREAATSLANGAQSTRGASRVPVRKDGTEIPASAGVWICLPDDSVDFESKVIDPLPGTRTDIVRNVRNVQIR